MTAAHTPGPWVADNGGDAFYGVFGPDGGALAYLLDVAPGVQWQSAILPMDPAITMRERFAIHEANAKLISAAPDLLEALQALFYACDSPALLRKARAALVKAGVL